MDVSSFTGPTLKKVIKFLDTLDGRDQAAKVVQYGSRSAMYYIRQHDEKSTTAKRFERTYKGASTSRKLFRMLKWLKEYQATLDSLKTSNELLRFLRIVQHMSLVVYYGCDNAVWFAKNKVFEIDSSKLGQRASIFWTLGLTATLLADLIEFQELTRKKEEARRFLDGEVVDGTAEMKQSEQQAAIKATTAKLFKLRLSIIKTAPSIVVAANSAKWIEAVTGRGVNDGLIGLCGVVAACTNIYKVWTSLK